MVRGHSGHGMGREKAGFTLLEALISMSLFAIILLAILMVYDTTQKTYVIGEAKVDLQQNVRVALDLILHDIRLGGYDPSNAINAQCYKYVLQPTDTLPTGCPPTAPTSYPALDTSQVRLIGDVDGDGTTDCVAYRRDSATKQILRRKTNWSSGNCTWTATESVVADNISALTFTYSAASGTTTGTGNPSDPNQARRVKAQITATSTTYDTTSSAESEASLRQ